MHNCHSEDVLVCSSGLLNCSIKSSNTNLIVSLLSGNVESVLCVKSIGSNTENTLKDCEECVLVYIIPVVSNLLSYVFQEVMASNLIREVLFRPCFHTTNNNHRLEECLKSISGYICCTIVVKNITTNKTSHWY